MARGGGRVEYDWCGCDKTGGSGNSEALLRYSSKLDEERIRRSSMLLGGRSILHHSLIVAEKQAEKAEKDGVSSWGSLRGKFESCF